MNASNAQLSRPHGTRPEDRARMLDLVNQVFLRSKGKAGDMAVHFPVLFADENLENCRIITADGRPVSHIAYLPRDAVVGPATIAVALIGAVCTDEQYRGRGLATRILDDCEERMRRSGVDVVVISGRRGLYTRRGARRAGICRTFQLTEDSPRPDAAPIEVRPGTLADRPAMQRLYDRRAVRFVRSADDWDGFLRSTHRGICVNPLYLAERDGEVVAYVSLDPQRESVPPTNDAYEWAGRAEAVAALMARLPGLTGRRLEITAQVRADDALIERLVSAGLEPETTDFWRTVKVLRPAALFEKLRPHLPAPASQVVVEPAEAEGARFRLGDDELELPVECLARLFFGDIRAETGQMLDGAGELGAALKRGLPVTLPRFGYNYT